MKVLVIQQKMIGDVLTSTILFEALRSKYPKAELHYLINETTYPVVENNPFIDHVILFTQKENSSKKAFFSLVKKIKQNNFDVVIDVYSKLSSNIISAYSRAKTKISYHKYYTTPIYHHNIKRLKQTDENAGLAIVNRLLLLKPLGIETNAIKPKIYLTKAEINSGKQFLKNHNLDFNKPIYMISVLGSREDKTYPFEYMAKLIDVIVKQTKGQILFNYIPKQKSQAKSIYNLCLEETQQHIYFNVFGQSLKDFLSITYHCDALIGNEGGAVNMAKALNIRTFTIFSTWLNKANWNIFEDKNNISVHLKDYKPDLYIKPTKKIKKEALTFYKQFLPSFIEPKLKGFLKNSNI